MGSEKPKKIRRKVVWIPALILLAGIPASYGIFNIFEPEHFPIKFLRGDVVEVSDRLVVGPYPTEDEIVRLKKLGVTELIGLMNSQMPFEMPLIAKEKSLAEKYKLGFRNVPLMYLPNLESKQNLARVAELVSELRESSNRVYVHCYLGRHRVGLVKTEYLKAMNPAGSTPSESSVPDPS